MKKSLIIAGIAALMLSSTMSYANTVTDTNAPKKPECNCKCQKQKPPKMTRQSLDDRLKLTDDQKKQAREIRMKGHEKIKPVFEKMKAKHEEIRTVKQSNLSEEEKAKKLTALKKDMSELKKQAREIRNENTKEFEAILTPEQKTEFEQIKKEARDRHIQMKKHRRGHHPGFGPGQRPLPPKTQPVQK